MLLSAFHFLYNCGNIILQRSFAGRPITNNLPGICQVVDHLKKVVNNVNTSNDTSSEHHTLYDNEEVLAVAEKIRNDTCDWVCLLLLFPVCTHAL